MMVCPHSHAVDYFRLFSARHSQQCMHIFQLFRTEASGQMGDNGVDQRAGALLISFGDCLLKIDKELTI